MDFVVCKKDKNILEFIIATVMTNLNCAIYLSGDAARKFLKYARLHKAETGNDVRIDKNGRVVLRDYEFLIGDESKINVKVEDNLDDREKFPIKSVNVVSQNGTKFSYVYDRNCKNKYVVGREVLINLEPSHEHGLANN